MSLSGQVLPVRVRRYDNEAITSWLVRLSQTYHQVPSTFIKFLLPFKDSAWKGDFDVYCPEELVEGLSQKCCVPQEYVMDGVLSSHRHAFDPYCGASSALPRWVVPMRTRKASDHYRGGRICPMCLKNNAYFTLYSRLMFYNVCPIHNLMMVDQCPRCHGSLSTHNLYPRFFRECSENALAFCSYCGFDLRCSTPIHCRDVETIVVRFFLRVMRDGRAKLNNSTFVYSHLYFQGIRLLMKGLLRKKQERLVRNLQAAFGLPVAPHMHKNEEVEHLSSGSRRALLLGAVYLMRGWPGAFKETNERYGLTKQDWVRPRDVVPFWFQSYFDSPRYSSYWR